MDLIYPEVTENGRYLLIHVAHGVPAKRVDVYAKDLRSANAPIVPVIHGIDSRFQPVNWADDLYVLTDYQAENYRVIKVSIANPAPEHWVTVVPEGKDVIESIGIVGGKLFVTGLHDVITQTQIYTLDGKPSGKIMYPTLGAASAVYGLQTSNNGFYSFESFTIPPAIYHYDVASGKTEVFAKPRVPFESDQYEVSQAFCTTKDGTRIPMFISGKKGLKRNGQTPTLMFAYGGFNVSLPPHWDPEYAWWMEQGGYFAQPNLRGGGEYGEAWHKAGMFEKKQNVFDDYFAAAQFLIDNQVHLTGAPCDPWAFQRRTADGRGHDAASGNVRRHLVWLPAARHAALPELSGWTMVDGRVWIGRECRAVPLPAEVLAVPQREEGSEISGDHVQYGRRGYAC